MEKDKIELAKDCKTKKEALQAQIDSIILEISEIQETRILLESTVMKDAVNPLTKKVPAEKFIR